MVQPQRNRIPNDDVTAFQQEESSNSGPLLPPSINTKVPALDPTKFSQTMIPVTREDAKSRGGISLLTVPRFGRLQVSAEAMIFDADDTQFEGSGEHLHDGKGGRFNLAVTETLEGVGFDGELDWQSFRQHTGQSEPAVCEGMCRAIEELTGQIIDPLVLQRRANEIVSENPDLLFRNVTLMPGIDEMLSHGKKRGCKLATCSASGEPVVHQGLKHFGIFDFFDEVVCNAAKKWKSNAGEILFSGVPVKDTCQALGVEPKNSVMFGDSMSDVGSALLAGIQNVIIRPISSGTENPQILQAELEEFVIKARHLAEAQGIALPQGLMKVYFVWDFGSQVRIYPQIKNSTSASVTPRSIKPAARVTEQPFDYEKL